MIPGLDTIIKAGTDLVKSYFPPDLSPEQSARLKQGLAALEVQSRDQTIEAFKVGQEYFHLDNKLIRSVRPVITYSVTGLYNAAMLYGVATGKISFQEYMTAIGPVNALLMGFWFGERSALKDPKK